MAAADSAAALVAAISKSSVLVRHGSKSMSRFAEFFDYGTDLEVQMSRHRFVMAGVASESARWERCRAEYRLIKNAQAYDDVPESSSDTGANR
jgi:hypothetical protein